MSNQNLYEAMKGLLVVAEDRYVLLHLDEEARVGKASGGKAQTGGVLEPGWEISVNGENGTVVVGKSLPALELKEVGKSAKIRDAEGHLLTFSSH